MKKINKQIYIYQETGCYTLPENLSEFIKFWMDKLDEVPEEYRDEAIIEVEPEPYYDSALLSISISYIRPETNEEFELRQQENEKTAELLRDQKLQQLEQLKKELGVE